MIPTWVPSCFNHHCFSHFSNATSSGRVGGLRLFPACSASLSISIAWGVHGGYTGDNLRRLPLPVPRPIPQTYILVLRSLPKLYIKNFTAYHGVGCGEMVLYRNNASSETRIDLVRPTAYRACAASRLFHARKCTPVQRITNDMLSGSCCARGSGGGILSKCGAGPRNFTGPSLTGAKLIRPLELAFSI